MARRLLNLLTIVSLLLCAATAALWVRSYSSSDYLFHVGAGAVTVEIVSADGRLIATTLSAVYPQNGPDLRTADGWHYRAAPADDGATLNLMLNVHFAAEPEVYWRRWGCALQSRAGMATVAAPHSFVVVGTSVPVLLLMLHKARRRPTASKIQVTCPACGYDLRATPGRCPECGSSPVP